MLLNIIRQHQHTPHFAEAPRGKPASGHPSLLRQAQYVEEGNKYYLYILECTDKTLYTGITVDLARRVREHNGSKLGAKYTKARRPVKLVYSKRYANRSKASIAENQIKDLNRKKKLELIASLNKVIPSVLPPANTSG